MLIVCVFIVILAICIYSVWPSNSSNSSSIDHDWRSKVDPDNILSNIQRYTLRASLKPILDKSSVAEKNSVSTLLLLSSDEDHGAKIARCILKLVNTESDKDKVNLMNTFKVISVQYNP